MPVGTPDSRVGLKVMAKPQKLKVFRTPIGFHDAYVAAPSQKAALEAWGADSNLFATGSAEPVQEPELMREPLAHPGKVIKRLRGTLAEHVAALPKTQPALRKPSQPQADQPAHAAPVRSPRPPKPEPRPSRVALERAEAALEALDLKHAGATAALARRQAELDKQRHDLEEKQAAERAKLAMRAEAAREAYDRALETWRA